MGTSTFASWSTVITLSSRFAIAAISVLALVTLPRTAFP